MVFGASDRAIYVTLEQHFKEGIVATGADTYREGFRGFAEEGA
jgi:hypothetical protein